MLQTLTFPGKGRMIQMQASFLRYESGTAGGADESIRVRADGQDLGTYYPGDSIELPQTMSAWEINPASEACAGIVRLGVGRVQSARVAGNVRVIDEIGTEVQSMTGGPAGTIGFSKQQLLDPVTNLRGFIIRSMSGYVQGTAGGVTNMRVVSSPAAPTDTNPGPNRLWMADVMSVGGQLVTFQFPFAQRRIPAGWGIWVVGASITQPLQQGQVFISGELG